MVGVAMILANLLGKQYLADLSCSSSILPFLFLAYKHIGKVFLWHMLFATMLFAASMTAIQHFFP